MRRRSGIFLEVIKMMLRLLINDVDVDDGFGRGAN